MIGRANPLLNRARPHQARRRRPAAAFKAEGLKTHPRGAKIAARTNSNDPAQICNDFPEPVSANGISKGGRAVAPSPMREDDALRFPRLAGERALG